MKSYNRQYVRCVELFYFRDFALSLNESLHFNFNKAWLLIMFLSMRIIISYAYDCSLSSLTCVTSLQHVLR